jgi:CreA protein
MTDGEHTLSILSIGHIICKRALEGHAAAPRVPHVGRATRYHRVSATLETRSAMKPCTSSTLAPLLALLFAALPAAAAEIGCVTTAWKLIGANHKVCVDAFSDPKVPGVTCHVSQARTGGVKGSFGLAQDPSQFSLACRQTGPITLPAKLPKDEVVFSEDTSLLFKETRIVRLWDEANRTLVYLAISRRIIEGAPANSISTVPVMPWGGAKPAGGS